MAEIELVCASIGFLFIGAILGMVIGLNAPDEEKNNAAHHTSSSTHH